MAEHSSVYFKRFGTAEQPDLLVGKAVTINLSGDRTATLTTIQVFNPTDTDAPEIDLNLSNISYFEWCSSEYAQQLNVYVFYMGLKSMRKYSLKYLPRLNLYSNMSRV